MVPSLPMLSCESSVSVKENPDRKKKTRNKTNKKYLPKKLQLLLISWYENFLHSLGLQLFGAPLSFRIVWDDSPETMGKLDMIQNGYDTQLYIHIF